MTRATARSFTFQEKRAFRLERWSLYVQLAVAVIAAVISFQALRDAGLRMGLQWAAPLLPLAIDGFAVIASLGIIRSQGAGERFGARASEWVGLCFVLGLSIAGNVAHALDKMEPDFPRVLAGLFGAAPPIIVAYGIHVYGRAMSSGVSRHVLVDDPEKIHFGLTHLGEGETVQRAVSETVQSAVPEPVPPAVPEPVPAAVQGALKPRNPAAARQTARPAVREAVPAAAQASGGRYPRDPERQRAFQAWGRLYTGQPVSAKDVLRAAEVSKNESTVRRWCRAWEKEADLDSAIEQTGQEPVQPGIRRSA